MRRILALAPLAAALLLVAAACGSDQATPSATAAPSATPYPQATLDPDSIDLLHLADEPPPPSGHLDPAAHGLTQDYTDPYGVFTEKMPPGPVDVRTGGVFDSGLYRAPVTVYTPRTTGSPPGQPEIDTFTIPDLQVTVDPADVQRRVVVWEAQRLAHLPAAGGAAPSLVGQRSGTFRQIPAMVFKLRAGGIQLKAITLVLGHTVYVISVTGSDDPPAAFDAFAVSFHLITNPSAQPSPTLPAPSTPSPSPGTTGTPTPGTSPQPGTSPTPTTGVQPTAGGASPGGGPPPPI